MKKLFFLSLVLLFTSIRSIAQESKSAMLLSLSPNQNHSYFNKSTHAYSFDFNEEMDYTEYGGKLGIGISILDGFGIPVRYYISPKMVAEAGLYSRTILLANTDFSGDPDFTSETSAQIGVGFTYFGDRFLKEKRKRNKVRAHGIATRLGHKFGNYQYTTGSIGWAMENFRENRTNKSFIFELGLQGGFADYVYNGIEYGSNIGVYLRCHWNFFID